MERKLCVVKLGEGGTAHHLCKVSNLPTLPYLTFTLIIIGEREERERERENRSKVK